MDGIVGDLPFCVCYVDDLLVFSSSKEEHLRYLLNRASSPSTKRPCSLPKDLKWGPLQEAAFCQTKNTLSTAAALTFPDPQAPLRFSTDASYVAIALSDYVCPFVMGFNYNLGSLRERPTWGHRYA
ncbi:uncharacterized protein [Palaemon carinicauda]|uniref:uncharacterized protein n=1 Tax=Palaemon carinicauda TaxID=392227 RepID=UPI0035B6A746